MVAAASRPTTIGRYELHGEIARGGMASVHLGRLNGPVGFSRAVAIKRLHPAFAGDQAVVRMFIDEARLTARLRHPNVVPVLDVIADGGELYLVMEYVVGLSLARIVAETRARGGTIPTAVACTIMVGVLAGLHAAHEATDEAGRPLGIVHRDVSPQNVMVGEDGVARVLDFGIAKANSRMQETGRGEIKGKLAYMSPEQLAGEDVDARSDVFAASIVFWELLTGERLFAREEPGATVNALLHAVVAPPHGGSAHDPLSAVVLRGLARNVDDRHPSALAMLKELEALGESASARAVGDLVTALRKGAGLTDLSTSGLEASVRTAAPVAAPAALLDPPHGPPLTSVTEVLPRPVGPPTPPARWRGPGRAATAALTALLLVGVAWLYGTRDRAMPVSSGGGQGAAPLAISATPPPPLPSMGPSTATAALPVAPGATAAAASAGPRRPVVAPARRPDCKVVHADGTFGYRPECLR
ncbi:MAG: serine/threonine protein kinase [Labilithrix sp.]|nr:serine/threonine protein kinase [Labilithrix sp.]